MSYQVIARKWRPQLFAEVVGQDVVTRTLQNAIKSDRIAHAFLFSGVRGVGKTTVARILAKALNCLEGTSIEPCGECVSCQEITDGRSIDVQEIDAASNRGIDNIRELRESVRYGTARDRYKIFIVDEVHMLTNEAFNALLKTLEEPPEHVKFILATTEYHKIPVTITFRCQQYEFRPITFALILERLRLITETDQITLSDTALRSLATVAQGSMRDAQSALDQIIAFSGKEIEDEDVRTLLGIVDSDLVIKLVQRIAERDREGLLAAMQDLRTAGISPGSFCSTLMSYVRSLMVTKVVGWDGDMVQLADASREPVEQQAKAFSELDLIRFYDMLNLTHNELRWHSHPEVHLEFSLLKLIELANLPAIEEVVGRLESGEPLERRSVGVSEIGQAAEPDVGTLQNPPSLENVSEPAKDSSSQPSSAKDPIIQLMAGLQGSNMGLYQHLQMASEVSLQGEELRIRFSGNERFHAGEVRADDHQKVLSKLAESIVGREVAIKIDVEGGENSNVEVADPMTDPKVQLFLDRFPGKIIVKRDSGV